MRNNQFGSILLNLILTLTCTVIFISANSTELKVCPWCVSLCYGRANYDYDQGAKMLLFISSENLSFSPFCHFLYFKIDQGYQLTFSPLSENWIRLRLDASESNLVQPCTTNPLYLSEAQQRQLYGNFHIHIFDCTGTLPK